MKLELIALCIVAGLSGCAMVNNTQFSAYQGEDSEIFGKGGTVKQIEGIDIWTNGSPNKKFRILGIIEQSHLDNGSPIAKLASMALESDLVKEAKKQGGDALILISSDTQITGYSTTVHADSNVNGNVYGNTYRGNVQTSGYADTHADTTTIKRIILVKYL